MKKKLLHAVNAWLFVALFTTSAFCQLPSGTTAPDFTLRNLDGETVSLSNVESPVVVLVIGTTWCPGCRSQMSELEKIREFFEANRIPVIDIFIQETAKTVRKYLKGKKLPDTFVALLDDGQVHRNYRVYPIPRVLVLDNSRHVIQDSLGMDGLELTDVLQQLLDRQPAPASRVD
ncbi:MAG: hypothetical protein PWP34_1831 [Desulfuromonadales bacterium]|jgi:peroxiredoxin|nr:hypothetical protein [Desulfuromonadales bacterium]